MTLKFIRNFENNQLVKLQKRAHDFEKPGLQYWTERLKEGTGSLDATHAEVQAFKEQVKELVRWLTQSPLFFDCVLNPITTLYILFSFADFGHLERSSEPMIFHRYWNGQLTNTSYWAPLLYLRVE